MTTPSHKAKNSDPVRGKTIRLNWTEGPTKGSAQDHIFHTDGTVEWHTAGDNKAAEKPERPAYSGVKVTDGVCLVSYLSKSGYTLTVALNLLEGTTVGIASNEKTWFPVKGTFEILA